MAETPCQKCKRERAELAARVRDLEEQCDSMGRGNLQNCERANAAQARVAELERALGNAIERLNEFLQAFEGAPDPSENDTKRLVARLEDVLHNEPG